MTEPSRLRKALTSSWLLFAACMAVYNANLRPIASYDSLATAILPFDLWRGEGLVLDRYAGLPSVIRYSMTTGRDGHLYIAYPIVTALVAAPLYAPAALFARFNADSGFRPLMEKLAASTIASSAVVLLYAALQRLVSRRRALALAALFAFGTSTWVISSQALWQHGTGELLLCAALALLVRPELSPRALAGLGVVAGLMVANRPPDLFLAGGVALAALLRFRGRAWPVFAAAGAVGLAFAVYNLTLFGDLVGGYAKVPGADFTAPSLATAAGLLFGSRGLLVYSPFLLGALFARRLPPVLERTWWPLLAGWIATFVFYCCFANWQAGACFGPRYLTDGLPILFVFLALAGERTWSAAARAAFTAAGVVAVLFQAVGAFYYPSGNSAEAPAIWRWEAFAVGAALAGGPATPDWANLIKPSLRDRASLASAGMRGSIAFVEPPPTRVRALSYVPVKLRLTNGSERTWSSIGTWFGLHAVRLGVSLKLADHPGYEPEMRADYWLSAALRPGETLERTVWIRTPPLPGRWTLVVQPIQRIPTEFEPFAAHGFEPLRSSLELTER